MENSQKDPENIQLNNQKFPSAREIEKKLKLSFGLFEMAFEIKKYQLKQKFSTKSDQELNYLTMELFEKGAKV
jgi:hypothetical protein